MSYKRLIFACIWAAFFASCAGVPEINIPQSNSNDKAEIPPVPEIVARAEESLTPFESVIEIGGDIPVYEPPVIVHAPSVSVPSIVIEETIEDEAVSEPVETPPVETAAAPPAAPVAAVEEVKEEPPVEVAVEEVEEAVEEEYPPLAEAKDPLDILVMPQQPARVPPSETFQGKPVKKAAERNFQVEQGSSLEIPFQGSLWVYLGEAPNTPDRGGVSFMSKSGAQGGTGFLFLAEREGQYALRFRRQDLSRGTSEEEIVNVAVIPKESAILGADILTVLPAEDGENAAIETAAIRAESKDGELWALAQSYENDSASRNVKEALRLYKQLVKDYPGSERYEDSLKRIAFIERFYVNIR